MEQTKAFISSLEEWNQEAKPESNEYATLLLRIGFTLGAEGIYDAIGDTEKEIRPDIIETRILDLINNQKLNEDFIISSLVKYVDEALERTVSGHGEALMLAIEARDRGLKTSSTMYERLTAPLYTYKALRELDTWRVIVNTRLGAANRREWINNYQLSMLSRIRPPQSS
jgi:hypothetical protein